MQYATVLYTWQSISCTAPAGTPAAQYGWPVGKKSGKRGSKPGSEMATQKCTTMKNPRQQNDVVTNPSAFDAFFSRTADLHIFPDHYFTDAPSPVAPERPSPEEQPFRQYIKNRLSHHQAPSDLLQRIRRTIQQDDI